MTSTAEQISGGLAADLAAALPDGLRSRLEQAPEPAQAFGIEEFTAHLIGRFQDG